MKWNSHGWLRGASRPGLRLVIVTLFGVTVYLGHTSKNALQHAHKYLKGVPTLQEPASDGPCKGCQLGKAHKRAFPTSSKRSNRILGLIHMLSG